MGGRPAGGRLAGAQASEPGPSAVSVSTDGVSSAGASVAVPGQRIEVEVSGADDDTLTTGKLVTDVVEASGLEALVIQHEMDHLDGVLILDRTPRDQR